MARVSTRRIIQWAGVEFQPNLRKPLKPIRLGMVLVETNARFRSISVAVIGRMPLIGSRPQEFREVGDVTMNITTRWVDHMFKDTIDVGDEDLFEKLAQRWKWNLYLRDTKRVIVNDHRSLEAIAKQAYQKFVGLPFKETVAPQGPMERAGGIPPAWQLEEFKRLKLGPHQVA